MFQVMGFNYAMCGYGSVEEMVKDMCVGEDKQLEAFARFVKLAKLHSYLEQKDWVGFAKRYTLPYVSASHTLLLLISHIIPV